MILVMSRFPYYKFYIISGFFVFLLWNYNVPTLEMPPPLPPLEYMRDSTAVIVESYQEPGVVYTANTLITLLVGLVNLILGIIQLKGVIFKEKQE